MSTGNYQQNKEKLRKQAHERYQNPSEEKKAKIWLQVIQKFSEKEKDKIRQYERKIYKNLSEDKKQMLGEYKKTII